MTGTQIQCVVFFGKNQMVKRVVHGLTSYTYLFQNSVIKKLLKFFIAVIDAELLKTVKFIVLWKEKVYK